MTANTNTDVTVTGVSLVVGAERKDFAFGGDWHNGDGASPDATAGQLLDHLRSVHGYRGDLSADRSELDVVHRGDHNHRGECGAHEERKDISSASGAGTSAMGGPQFGLAPVARGAPVAPARRKPLRRQRFDSEEPEGKVPAPRSGRPRPRGGATLSPLRTHKRLSPPAGRPPPPG